MLDRETVSLESVFDKKVADVDVFRISSARLPPILLESYRTLIVLVKYIADDCVPLPFHELPCPNCIWEVFACAYELGFCGAFDVDLLLVTLGAMYTCTEGDCSTGVAPHVCVHGVGGINPCFHFL